MSLPILQGNHAFGENPRADDASLQTIRDGKSIIIEGLHLDPGLYLHEFGKYGISHLHTRSDSMLPAQPDTARPGDAVLVEPVNPEPMNPDRDVQRGARLEPDDRYAFPHSGLAALCNPHGNDTCKMQTKSSVMCNELCHVLSGMIGYGSYKICSIGRRL